MFKFIPNDIPECEQINTPEGRRYKTPYGKIYPSVTTILSRETNVHLMEWIRAVGQRTADEIASKAAKRGTKVHSLYEAYLRTWAMEIKPWDSDAGEMFNNMIPELNKFEEIYALEQRLWSDHLQCAGTVDCIARVDGKIRIVDFKTSGRYKSREEIPTYFMQCAAYAMCWFERTAQVVTDLRVIITTQDDGVLVYDECVKDWLPKFAELARKQ